MNLQKRSDNAGRTFTLLFRFLLILFIFWIVSRGLDSFASPVDLLRDYIHFNGTTWYVMLGICLIYMIVLAIPFVPGSELGILIMVFFGKPGIVSAYLFTLFGLSIGFAFGRKLPRSIVLLVYKGNPKIESLFSKTPSRWKNSNVVRFINKVRPSTQRMLAVGIALNLPFNAAIGGGGGIVLLAGLDRRFPFRQFLATICIATAPLPLLVFASNELFMKLTNLVKTF